MSFKLVALTLLWLVCAQVLVARPGEAGVPAGPMALTQEERAWLDENHTVRVRIADSPPYQIIKPIPSGVVVDYLQAIAKHYGFKVDFVASSHSWAEALEDLRGPHRHYDRLPVMFRTPEREQEFALTDDYLTAPWVVYTRNDTPYIAGLESLSGKTVAAEKGFVITDRIRRDYPLVRILEVPGSRQALEAVATGQAEAYVGNLAIANFLIKESRFTNLEVAAPTPYGLHTQAMGVRGDWPALASLINKGLAAMTPAEIHAINQKWGAVEIRPRTDYTLVWQVAAAATLVLLAVFSWNRRLAREVATRQAIETDLRGTEAALHAEQSRLRQAQGALEDLNQTLEDQVRQRTAELDLATETLRRSEERYRLLIENARDVIWTMTLDGTPTYVSPAVEQVRGFTPDETLRQSLDAMLAPASHAVVREYLARLRAALQAGQAPEHFRGELEFWRKDGAMAWADVMAYPLLGPDGALIEILGMTRDIDERKRYERMLRDSRDAAEAANRAKSEFLANMSHEIRTPMNAILGFAQVLARDPDLTAAQRDSLATIQPSGDHLLNLINDILDMAKIEAGRVTLRAEPFDLSGLMREVEDFFRPRVRERGLTLTLEAAALPSRVVGDVTKLRQVLINLVGNAVKFTTAGGVTLRVAPVAGDTLRFDVSDTGPGIAPEEQARLFQPFGQTASGQQVSGGTGLGLAISRRFVRLMGGELSVDSTPGQGSRFAFTLALPPSDAVLPAAAPTQAPILGLEPGQPVRRVLIVDDLADNRAPLRALLESLNPTPPVLEIREAADGQEAVAVWETWRPHVIFMDMRMPLMSGEEATRRIKARMADQPDATRTLVVGLSANAFDEQRDRFLAAGCDDFTGKPFRAEAVLAILEDRAGWRFRRAGAGAELGSTAAAPLSPAALTARLAARPLDWRAKLQAAVELGDFGLITTLVEEVDAGDAALRQALAQWAYQYDLEAFSRALAGLGMPPPGRAEGAQASCAGAEGAGPPPAAGEGLD